MKWLPPRQTRIDLQRRPLSRRGAVFVALVVVLLIVVTAATRSMVQNAVTDRSRHVLRRQSLLLQSAVIATKKLPTKDLLSIHLPVAPPGSQDDGETPDHSIRFLVHAADSTSTDSPAAEATFDAVLFQGDLETDRMTFTRKISSTPSGR